MKKIKKLFKIFVVLMIVAVISYGGLYAYAKMIDKVKITNNNSYLMYDNTDEIFNMSNSWVPLEDISENLVKATLSIEDKNFYKHIGFDYLRIAKALLINLESKKNVQGASTITQQYAKNLFLDFDKTWDRKINEAWITIQLESHYSKDEILEGYLNTINYGGVFGIDNASYYYFGKSSKDLTLAEASIIAGIPKSPSNYSPITNLNNAKRRQRIILNSMVKNNYIIQSEADKAYNENLKYIGENKNNESKTLMYYQDAVLNELNKIKDIPKSLMKTGSLKIFTNLDLKTQIDLEKNLNTNMEIDDELQTSSIMMNPKNGKIIALIGGRDYPTLTVYNL